MVKPKKIQEDNEEDPLKRRLKKLLSDGGFVLGRDNLPDQTWISTGSLVLDYAISDGYGYPGGKFIEIFGAKSSGKTLLSLIAAANVTRQGKYVLYCDAEDNINSKQMMDWPKKLGIDDEYFIILPPMPGEDLINKTVKALKDNPNLITLMIIDSIAAISSEKTIEKGAEERTVAEEARLVRKWINQLMPVKKDTCIMMLNQQIANIGTYGGGKVTKGGSAPAYFAGVRLEVKGKPIPNPEGELTSPLYHDITVLVDKNKVGPPKRVADLVFDFYQMGFDHPSEILPLALEKGIITKKPPMYYMDYQGEQLSFKGKEALKEHLRENEELMTYLKDNILG